MYTQTPKVVGETCQQCGVAKNVQNPKTGKVFCEAKCWLNGQQGTTPQYSSPQAPQAQIKPRDFDAEARGKVRHGFAIEAFKKGMALSPVTAAIIDEWTDFVVTGKIESTPEEIFGGTPAEPTITY